MCRAPYKLLRDGRLVRSIVVMSECGSTKAEQHDNREGLAPLSRKGGSKRIKISLMSLEVRTSSVSESQQWSVAFLFPKGIGTTESALRG